MDHCVSYLDHFFADNTTHPVIQYLRSESHFIRGILCRKNARSIKYLSAMGDTVDSSLINIRVNQAMHFFSLAMQTALNNGQKRRIQNFMIERDFYARPIKINPAQNQWNEMQLQEFVDRIEAKLVDPVSVLQSKNLAWYKPYDMTITDNSVELVESRNTYDRVRRFFSKEEINLAPYIYYVHDDLVQLWRLKAKLSFHHIENLKLYTQIVNDFLYEYGETYDLYFIHPIEENISSGRSSREEESALMTEGEGPEESVASSTLEESTLIEEQEPSIVDVDQEKDDEDERGEEEELSTVSSSDNLDIYPTNFEENSSIKKNKKLKKRRYRLNKQRKPIEKPNREKINIKIKRAVEKERKHFFEDQMAALQDNENCKRLKIEDDKEESHKILEEFFLLHIKPIKHTLEFKDQLLKEYKNLWEQSLKRRLEQYKVLCAAIKDYSHGKVLDVQKFALALQNPPCEPGDSFHELVELSKEFTHYDFQRNSTAVIRNSNYVDPFFKKLCDEWMIILFGKTVAEYQRVMPAFVLFYPAYGMGDDATYLSEQVHAILEAFSKNYVLCSRDAMQNVFANDLRARLPLLWIAKCARPGHFPHENEAASCLFTMGLYK
jgi:hypothetical protein